MLGPEQASLKLRVIWVKLLTTSAHEIHLPSGKGWSHTCPQLPEGLSFFLERREWVLEWEQWGCLHGRHVCGGIHTTSHVHTRLGAVQAFILLKFFLLETPFFVQGQQSSTPSFWLPDPCPM